MKPSIAAKWCTSPASWSPPSSADLNASTKALRELERKFRDAAATTPDPAPSGGGQALGPPANLAATIRRAGHDKYNAYIDAARNVRIQFESITGVNVNDASIEPSLA
jgi:hypothetical protein